MKTTLRPMGLGEILDRAIQILRSNLGLYMGIAVFPALASLGTSLGLHYASSARGSGVGGGLAYLFEIPFSIAGLILSPLGYAAKCWATSQLVLDKPTSVRAAYGAFLNRKGRLVALSIGQGFLSFWPLIPIFFVAAAFMGGTSSPAPYTGIVFLPMVPCAPLVARYLLAFPASAVLDADVHHSLRRSVELGRGFRWKVFWAYFLPMGIAWALDGGGTALIEMLKTSHGIMGRDAFLCLAIGDVWTFLVNLVFQPLGYISLTLVYYDLCVRKEGLDVALMMEQAGMGATAERATAAGEQPA